MKTLIATFMLSTIVSSSAFAATFTYDSRIDAVTVFPRGAQVTRIARGKIEAGSHVIVIENMPNTIDVNSLRVEGVSGSELTIGSVDIRKVIVHGKDRSPERRMLEEKINDVTDAISALQKSLKNNEIQQSLLTSLVMNSAASNGEELTKISAVELDIILNISARRMQDISERDVKITKHLRDLNRDLEKYKSEHVRLAPFDEIKTVVEINVKSTASSDAVFNVKYSIQNAGWVPVYNANLSINKSSAETSMLITRKANVYQKTTENWQNVKLKLSTARLTSATHAPQLNSWQLEENRREYRRSKNLMVSPSAKQELGFCSLDSHEEIMAAVPVQKSIVAMPAPVKLDYSGFHAEYIISGLTSVSNKVKMKSVTIGEDELAVTLSAVSVPHKDPTTYLVANFKLNAETSYLPGTVFLNREGAFIGEGRLPLLSAGEEFSLGFGRDDLIQITHREVDKKRGESGFISTVKLDERSFLTEITYRHNFPMDVKIIDQMPVSNHEDIKVSLTSKTTKPTEINVDDKRGILAWTQTMNADETAIIHFGYKISWPEDMKLKHIN